MVIKLNQTFKGFDGAELKDNLGKVVSLKEVCCQSLVMKETEDSKTIFDRYNLAMKINSSEEIELDAEQISDIKMLISKTYTPIIAGAAMNMLEGK